MIALSNRPSRIATAAFFTFILFITLRSNSSFLLRTGLFRKPPPPPATPPPPPRPRFELLGIKDFGAEAEIATLYIKPREVSQGGVPLQQSLPISLPKFASVRLDDGSFNASALDEFVPGHPPATITVDVTPIKEQPDASHIIFGAATTLERMAEALKGFRHWAADTNTRFIFIVEPQNTTAHPGQPSSAETIALYKEAGIALTLIESTERYLDRYVALLGALYKALDAKTKWATIIDDDTFFFSMNSVNDMLAKYDTRQQYYVGATSENKWNIDEGGIFAIGGAGVFMSRALIDEMGPRSDECVHLPNGYGDSRVADCIFKYTPTKLSHEHGLYQLDLHGDVTGFYEAVRPQPVGVHHWKTWHHHDMPTIAKVASICGQSCVLQNFKFADGYQMANGFSIVKYSYNETQLAGQVEQAMEHTWKKTIWDIPTSWKYSLEPLKDRDEGKVQYLIEKAVEDKKAGTVTLYYVRRKDGFGTGMVRVVWQKPGGGLLGGGLDKLQSLWEQR